MRASVLSNQEFDQLNKDFIKSCSHKFYKYYEAVYGKINCSYSIHTFASHILQIRGDSPLTQKSAFRYESFYSEVRNLFQAGTQSPTKQIIKNCLMKRCLEGHSCERKIHYDVEKNGKENNHLIYTIENNKYNFFSIKSIRDDQTFLCTRQGKFEFIFDETPEICWEKVGVFKVGPTTDFECVINKCEVKGKIIKVNEYLLTCPLNVLREQ